MSPAASSTSVTELRAQRVVKGGHSDGAVQSPATSHGVGTQWPPAHIAAAAIHIKVTNAAQGGTASRPMTSHRRMASDERTIVHSAGRPAAATAARAISAPARTSVQLANNAEWLRIAVASGVSSTVQ